ncbi:hypothetical protein ACTMTI_49435 [Nonomuraea sp. H19]
MTTRTGCAVFGYFAELIARKEREPGDDLLSRLPTLRLASGLPGYGQKP